MTVTKDDPGKYLDPRTLAKVHSLEPKARLIVDYSPNTGNAVRIELGIIAYDGNAFDNYLGDNQPVERIAVMEGKRRLNVGVFNGDWQDGQAKIADGFCNPRLERQA